MTAVVWAAGSTPPASSGPFPGITNVTSPADVAVPPYAGPRCLPQPGAAVSGARVLVLVADGSEADDAMLIRAFAAAGGATVVVACADSGAQQVAAGAAQLVRTYYPLCAAACAAVPDLAGYDLVVVGSGYGATIGMRRSAGLVQAVQAVVRGVAGAPRELLLIGGGTEVIVDAAVVPDLLRLGNGSSIPTLTPSTTAAAVAVPTCRGSCVVANTSATFAVAGRTLSLAAGLADVPLLLAGWAARRAGAFPPPLSPWNCSAPALPAIGFDPNTTARAWPAVTMTLPTAAAWAVLGAGAGGDSFVPAASTIDGEVPRHCRNADGIDFCTGAMAAIVVAHGAQDTEVIATAAAVGALGMTVVFFCTSLPAEALPDRRIYLMPALPRLPTYAVACADFTNHTDLLDSSLVLVPNGPVATHRALRRDPALVRALQYTGTYSLYGSALAMLDAVLVSDDMRPPDVPAAVISSAPFCATTVADMASLGLNTSGPAAAPVMLFRSPTLRRTKVLGGFNTTALESPNLVAWIATSVEALVWPDAGRSRDTFVTIVIFGGTSAVIVFLALVLCGAIL